MTEQSLKLLKLYDICRDEYREAEQADIDQLESFSHQFGALRRIMKLLGKAKWNEMSSIENAIHNYLAANKRGETAHKVRL